MAQHITTDEVITFELRDGTAISIHINRNRDGLNVYAHRMHGYPLVRAVDEDEFEILVRGL